MSDKKWTPEQGQAIAARNRNILVSAAAGSGKTAVLVERIIKKVTDPEHPVDIDRLLVVTFTKAAAQEMKERIRKAIARAVEANPGDMHLQQQLTLVHNAQITTIDSFCTYIVRNHFNEIDLEPDFRIAEEGEMLLLRQDVMDQVLQKHYEDADEDFQKLVEAYTRKSRDNQLPGIITKLYQTAASYPWPKKWLRGLTANYEVETVDDLKNQEWLQWVVERTRSQVEHFIQQEEAALDICGLPEGPAQYVETLEADIRSLQAIAEAASYEEMQLQFSALAWTRMSGKRSGDPELKDKAKAIRDGVKKSVDKLAESFETPLEKTLAQMKMVRPFVETLANLTEEYMDAFAAKKRAKNVLDFSDLEHMALKVLRAEDDTILPAAEEFQLQYEEIMIDEYQDSNYLQESILTAISKHGDGTDNMFMVGDVKQSIYAFRQARPDLFMDKMDLYPKYGPEEGQDAKLQRIDLAKNFRSRIEVLHSTNDICYRIMAKDLGNVPYTKDVALYLGNTGYQYPEAGMTESANPKEDPYATEVLLADCDDAALEELDVEDKTSLEARIVADRINALKKTLKVTDEETGELRPMKYSDVVILMRSPNSAGTGDAYVQVMMDAGIPAHLTSSEGYFHTTEISQVLALLQLINNPCLDIPLEAVLHSTFGKFSNDDSMMIRGAYPKESAFYKCFQKLETYAKDALGIELEDDESLKEVERPEIEIPEELLLKVSNFSTWLKSLRRKVADTPIHELIMDIFRQTGYMDYVTGLPGGAVRRANLEKLLDQAIAFERTSYKGLYRFNHYMDNLQKYEQDFGTAELIGEDDDAVRIMSIHKSKGLEFPVVFICGTGKNMNTQDAKGAAVIHSKMGLGLDMIDLDLRKKQTPLIKKVIEQNIRQDMQGEELRVLYVALTRAKEKLIITGTVKGAAEYLEKEMEETYGKPEGYILPLSTRLSAQKYIQWIIPALLSYGEDYVPAIRVITPEEMVLDDVEELVKRQQKKEHLSVLPKLAREDLKEEITSRLDYVYPHASDSRFKTKYSVSEIKHMAMEASFDETESKPLFTLEEEASYVPAFIRQAMGQTEEQEDQGSQLHGGRIVTAGALHGTAMHRAMECFDFGREDYRSILDQQIAFMLADGRLTAEEEERLNRFQLQKFIDSEMGERLHQATLSGTFYSEQAFVMGGEPKEFFGVLGDHGLPDGDEDTTLTVSVEDDQEMILVQGIIDCFFEEDGGIVLLDYKTDRVKDAGELINRYQAQLRLYADAIERTRDLPVTHMYMYSFSLGELVEV